MKVTLYDSQSSLPQISGKHILVYTGADHSTNLHNPVIVTQIYCLYIVDDKRVEFKKNAEGTSLRFEDAVNWAVRYAKIFDIPDVHAVFELTRRIDPQFLRKIETVQLIDRRSLSTSGPYRGIPKTTDRTLRQAAVPKSMLQRHSVLRGNLSRRRDSHRGHNLGRFR